MHLLFEHAVKICVTYGQFGLHLFDNFLNLIFITVNKLLVRF